MPRKQKTAANVIRAPKSLGRLTAAGIIERREAFAKSDPLRVVLVTAPAGEAEKIARTLVEARLVACANLLPGVRSIYWWEGKVEESDETLIVMKTMSSKINKLLRRVRELHSYSVPEFVALAATESNPAYSDWVAKETESRMP